MYKKNELDRELLEAILAKKRESMTIVANFELDSENENVDVLLKRNKRRIKMTPINDHEEEEKNDFTIESHLSSDE